MRKKSFKSIIYRYTGIFLANEEQMDYVESEEFWEKFKEYGGHKKSGMGARNTQGLLIGIWQAHHGYARPWSSLGRFRKPKFFWGTINWFATLFEVIKWDTYGILWSDMSWWKNYGKKKK